MDPNNPPVIETETNPSENWRFFDLKKFHMYNLTVKAFTEKGSGPEAFASAFTDQDGNSNPFT